MMRNMLITVLVAAGLCIPAAELAARPAKTKTSSSKSYKSGKSSYKTRAPRASKARTKPTGGRNVTRKATKMDSMSCKTRSHDGRCGSRR